jgi:hypothetical protein
MSHLKSLTLCVAPTNGVENPIIYKRQKLIERLEQQRLLAQDPSFSLTAKRSIKHPDGTRSVTERQVKVWWRMDDRGSVVLMLRVGFRAIELEKGKTGIFVGSMEQLPEVIGVIMAAVRDGELDHHFTKGVGQELKTPSDARRPTLTLPSSGSGVSAQ